MVTYSDVYGKFEQRYGDIASQRAFIVSEQQRAGQEITRLERSDPRRRYLPYRRFKQMDVQEYIGRSERSKTALRGYKGRLTAKSDELSRVEADIQAEEAKVRGYEEKKYKVRSAGDGYEFYKPSPMEEKYGTVVRTEYGPRDEVLAIHYSSGTVIYPQHQMIDEPGKVFRKLPGYTGDQPTFYKLDDSTLVQKGQLQSFLKDHPEYTPEGKAKKILKYETVYEKIQDISAKTGKLTPLGAPVPFEKFASKIKTPTQYAETVGVTGEQYTEWKTQRQKDLFENVIPSEYPSIQYLLTRGEEGPSHALKTVISKGITGEQYERVYNVAYQSLDPSEKIEYSAKFTDWQSIPLLERKQYIGAQQYFESLPETEKIKMLGEYKQTPEWKKLGVSGADVFNPRLHQVKERKIETLPSGKTKQTDIMMTPDEVAWEYLTVPKGEIYERQFSREHPVIQARDAFFSGGGAAVAFPVVLSQMISKLVRGKGELLSRLETTETILPDVGKAIGKVQYRSGAPAGLIGTAIGEVWMGQDQSFAKERQKKFPMATVFATGGEIFGMYAGGRLVRGARMSAVSGAKKVVPYVYREFPKAWARHFPQLQSPGKYFSGEAPTFKFTKTAEGTYSMPPSQMLDKLGRGGVLPDIRGPGLQYGGTPLATGAKEFLRTQTHLSLTGMGKLRYIKSAVTEPFKRTYGIKGSMRSVDLSGVIDKSGELSPFKTSQPMFRDLYVAGGRIPITKFLKFGKKPIRVGYGEKPSGFTIKDFVQEQYAVDTYNITKPIGTTYKTLRSYKPYFVNTLQKVIRPSWDKFAKDWNIPKNIATAKEGWRAFSGKTVVERMGFIEGVDIGRTAYSKALAIGKTGYKLYVGDLKVAGIGELQSAFEKGRLLKSESLNRQMVALQRGAIWQRIWGKKIIPKSKYEMITGGEMHGYAYQTPTKPSPAIRTDLLTNMEAGFSVGKRIRHMGWLSKSKFLSGLKEASYRPLMRNIVKERTVGLYGDTARFFGGKYSAFKDIMSSRIHSFRIKPGSEVSSRAPLQIVDDVASRPVYDITRSGAVRLANLRRFQPRWSLIERKGGMLGIEKWFDDIGQPFKEGGHRITVKDTSDIGFGMKLFTKKDIVKIRSSQPTTPTTHTGASQTRLSLDYSDWIKGGSRMGPSRELVNLWKLEEGIDKTISPHWTSTIPMRKLLPTTLGAQITGVSLVSGKALGSILGQYRSLGSTSGMRLGELTGKVPKYERLTGLGELTQHQSIMDLQTPMVTDITGVEYMNIQELAQFQQMNFMQMQEIAYEEIKEPLPPDVITPLPPFIPFIDIFDERKIVRKKKKKKRKGGKRKRVHPVEMINPFG